jgi:hypothetical protein
LPGAAAGAPPLMKRHTENFDSVMVAYFLPILLQKDAMVTKRTTTILAAGWIVTPAGIRS